MRTITRQHRTAYLLLLDTSGSMQDIIEYDGRIMTKGQSMVDAANRILQELYFRAHRDGEIRNYYDVAVISYSGRGVISLLGGDDPFIPITELSGNSGGWIDLKCLTPLNAPDEYHGSSITLSPEGYTPMYETLYITHELIKEWCNRPENYDSAPPSVYNISDGHATDGDFKDIRYMSEKIMSLSTNDGNVLMFNIHLSSMPQNQKILFPTEEELRKHPNAFFRAMALASSPMPEHFRELIHEIRGERSSATYRGVGYNVSVVDMIAMMNIGTLSVPIG